MILSDVGLIMSSMAYKEIECSSFWFSTNFLYKIKKKKELKILTKPCGNAVNCEGVS